MGFRLRDELLYYGLRVLQYLNPRQSNMAELGTDTIQRIVLVSTTALGDALLSTPAIHAIRRAYPWAKISLLLNPAYQDLFIDHPDVDEIIPYAGKYQGFLRALRQLRAQTPDLVCILHANEPQATPLAWLSGARFIFKLPNTSRFRFLLTNREPIKQWENFPHGIDQRLAVAALARAATDFIDAKRMRIPLRPADQNALTNMLSVQGISADTRLLGLQIGASTRSRRWSIGHFIALGQYLLATYTDVALLLTGSPAERALCQTVANALLATHPERLIWVSAGETPLRLLPALFARLTALVSGDTGPMHLAITVGTPIVGLFAASDWRRSGPAYDIDIHQIIQKARTCDPCLSKRCPYQEPICMANILVPEVITLIEKIMHASPQTKKISV